MNIIKEADKLGYEINYKVGVDGQGWYLRSYGTTNELFFGKTAEEVAEKLFVMKETQEETKKKYVIKNDFDKEFYLNGNIEDLKYYFDIVDAVDIEDVLDYANDTKYSNGSTYYIYEEA